MSLQINPLFFTISLYEKLYRECYLLYKRKSSQKTANWKEIQGINSVFVLSTGRAGTKLLTNILKKYSELWVEHSPSPTLAQQSSLIYQEKVSGKLLEWSFLHARLDLLSHTYRAGLHYVETNNRISMYAPAIANLLPHAKFIHLVRHPGEFVRSGMRRGYYDTMDPEQWGHLVPRRNDPIFHTWQNLNRIEKISWQWNEINRQIETFKQTIDSERVLFIKSDNLFSSPETSRKIAQFMGIEPIENEKIKRILQKKVNRQTRGDFPKYPDWSTEEKDSLKRMAQLASSYDFKL